MSREAPFASPLGTRLVAAEVNATWRPLARAAAGAEAVALLRGRTHAQALGAATARGADAASSATALVARREAVR